MINECSLKLSSARLSECRARPRMDGEIALVDDCNYRHVVIKDVEVCTCGGCSREQEYSKLTTSNHVTRLAD